MKTTDKLGLQYLNDLKAIAALNGGVCLSKEYINSTTHLLWRCASGHVWEGVPASIKQGKWCSACAFNRNRATMVDMQEIAAEHRGKCLSKEYINTKTKLKWCCEKGHTWDTTPALVRVGKWCPQCYRDSRKGTLEDMQQIAIERGGKCLSKKYINSRTKLKWQCEKGHIWETTPADLKRGSWCHECAFYNRKKTIEDMRHVAAEHGGKCLSKTYINNLTPLLWCCKEGHKWKTTPARIKVGTWCWRCSVNERKDTIEEMQQIAEEHGGKCLSKKYVNSQTKLKWQCKKGHKWSSVPNAVTQGSWCLACYNDSKKTTMEEIQKVAAKRGGVCLSKEYIGPKTNLLWACGKGHTWGARLSQIKLGKWCSVCFHTGRRRTIEEMQQIAKEHGSKCLSKEYVNSHSNFEWQCKKGHRWFASPSNSKRSKWCLICFRNGKKASAKDA
jgi:hypothetical protein